jgi:hypothetical protein
MAAGWNVRVTSFDAEGKPGNVRNFLAYEPDKARAVELVRKRTPCAKESKPKLSWRRPPTNCSIKE